MKKTIKYLQDGEYHYATVKDVGDVEQLKTKHKEDLVTALNELFTTGGEAKPTGYDDLVKKVNDTQTNLNGINGEVSSVKDKVNGITSNGGGRNLVANTGTDIVVDATSDNASDYKFATLNFAERPKQGDLITVSAEGTLTGTGTLDEYQVVLYNLFTTNPRSQAQYLKAGKRDSVTLSLDNLNGDGDTVLLIYAGKAGETKGKKNVIHHLMVEKGTIAHDWQPAPEDTDSAIESVSSKIDQTADGINNTITDINGKVVANDEAIAQAKKDLQDALTQFQTFNDEIEQAKKDAETKLADAKQALKDEFNNNLADAQKANQKQLEDKIAVIQGNLDTTSNTLNDVKTQLTNARLDYGNVNVSIQKLNDMLATKLSSTDLDPLRASIQNQESEIQQTKDSIATKAGKAEFDVLSGRVSNTEAKIKQQADEINLGVKKSELNGAIDNYQIEGTNRLRDTIDFDIDNGYWKLDQYSINSNTDVHPYDQAHDVSALVLQKTGSAKQDVDFANEDLGNSFVISVWNKKDAQPQVWYGNTRLTNRQVAAIKGDYERSFFTFIPTNINVKTIMFKYDAGTVDQLVIGEPKLELGTEPKTYAPNPNDEHKQIVNTKAELKIASDKIESAVEKQTKTDDNINQLSSRVTQTEQGITATNDLITKTKDGLIKDYTGKINASAKSLSSEFEEKTDEKIGQITDSGENLILNSAFTNETDRKDKWQNISDKVNIVSDSNGLMWAKMSQSGLTSDNPIGLTSNYFPIKQGKITVGVDVKSDNTNGLSGDKILVLQTYNANKQRIDFTELTLENMGLTVQQLADGQSHRGVYRLGNDRSDAVYMTVKAVLPRNGSIYFTNFSAKLSSIDNGGYTPNAEDLKRQILNQKTKIEQNSQQITLKASSTELRDVRTIANGAVSSANDANNKISTIQTNGGGRNLFIRSLPTDINNLNGWSIDEGYVGTHPYIDHSNTNLFVLTNSTNHENFLWSPYVYLENGETYTLSYYAFATINTMSSGEVCVINYDDSEIQTITDKKKLSESKAVRYVHTFVFNKPSGKSYRFRFDNNGSNNGRFTAVYIGKPMLEKGTVAHEWQLAPEDTQRQIDANKTSANNAQNTANTANTNANQAVTTANSANNKVDAIQANGGGRNLLKGTQEWKGEWENLSFWNVAEDTYTGLVVRSFSDPWWSLGQYYDAKPNTTYTFSFYAKASEAGNIMDIFTLDSEDWSSPVVSSPVFASQTITTEWQRYSVTFTTKSGGKIMPSVCLNENNITIYVAGYMLEEGTVTHTWSPAPEDVQTQIDANKTSANNAQNTANQANTTANSALTNANNANTTANTANTNATSAVSVANSAKSTADSANNNANQAVNTANSAKSNANSAVNTANQANTTANTANTNATSAVNTANQAKSKVDNLQIGGTNLLKDTNKMTNTNYWGLRGAQSIRAAYGGQRANEAGVALSDYNVKGNSSNPYIDYIPQVSFEQGTDYTVSFWTTTVDALILYLNANDNANHQHNNSQQNISLQASGRTYNGWKQVTATFKPKVATAYLTFAVSTNWVSSFKLEKGNKATDWQPAPEDIQSQINQARTDIQSTLTVANNGITAATNLKTTYDNYVQKNDANIKLLGDRITNEVSKITSNGGGRNLWLGSKSLQNISVNIPQVDWNADNDGITTAHITGTGGFYGKWQYIYADSTEPFAIGDSATFSVEMKGTGTITIGREYDFEKNVTLTDTWTRYSVSGEVKSANRAHIMYNNSGKDCDAYVRLPMVEKGTIAHDWSPAPEDTNSQIEAVSSKIDQTATSITSTVNSTKQDLQGQINSANTKITQTANGIEQTVKKITDVQNNVNNLKEKVDSNNGGGINLLTGSKTMHGVWVADGTSIFSADDYSVVSATGNNMRIYQNPSEDTNGKLMSVSFDALVPADSKNQSVQIWVGPFEAGVNVTISGNTFKRYKVENWKWNSANKAFSIQFKNANDKINIKNIKLEFGAVATPWSPAPEDVESTHTLDTANIDEMKSQGHYFVHNLTGTPIPGWVYVDVTGNNNDRIRQDVYADNGTKHMSRRLFGNSWSGWKQGAYLSDVNNVKTEVTASVKNLGDRVTTEVNSVTKKINDSHTNDVELIRNNNFPDGNKGSWNGNLTTVVNGNSIPAELGQNGMKVLRVAERDTYEDDIWYSVKPGEIFDVDYWIWPTGSYDSRLGLYFVDKDKGASDWRGVVAKKGTGWTHYTGTIEAPSNAAFAKPWIQVEKDASETDSAAWIGKPSIRRHDSFAEQKISEINTKLEVANGQIQGKVTEKQVHDLLNNEHYATESWTQAQLKLTSDNFNVSVGKMAQKLDNLTIGGRNLIYGTTDFELLYSGTFTDSITIRQVLIDNELAQKASTMTYSATIRPEDAESPVQLAIYKTKGDSAHTRVSNTPIAVSSTVHYSDSKRLSLTFNLDQDMKEIEIVALVAGSNTFKMFGVKEEKLEIGSVPTDWSPAPEEYAKTSNIISTINMSPEQIKLSSNKIVLDGDTEIKGTAFIPSAAIKDITADKITAGTLDVGKLDIKNLTADDIKTGTLSGITVRAGDEDSFFQTSKDNIYWITKSSGSALIGRGKYVRYPGLNIFDKSAVYLGSWAGAVLNQDGTINDRGGAFGNPKFAIETAGMQRNFNLFSQGGELVADPLDHHRIISWVGHKEFLSVEQGHGTHIELNPNINGSQFTVQKDNRFGAYFGWGRDANEITFNTVGGMTVNGNFRVTGAKNAIVKTSQGTVAINAYETAGYFFGDIGSAKTSDNKVAMIDIESLFKETVNTDVEYQVFLTSYGPGDIWVSERQRDYFVVESELPNMEFGWEIKAKRKGYENTRLAKVDVSNMPTV